MSRIVAIAVAATVEIVTATTFDVVRTERLVGVRPEHPRDIEAFVELWTDPDVTRHLTGVLEPARAEQILRHDIDDWNTYGYGVWLFRHLESGDLVGRGGLQFTDLQGRADLDVGAILLPRWWHHGFGREIAVAAAHVAFTDLRADSVTAMTDPDNEPALRSLADLGYRPGGTADYNGRPFACFRLVNPDPSPE